MGRRIRVNHVNTPIDMGPTRIGGLLCKRLMEWLARSICASKRRGSANLGTYAASRHAISPLQTPSQPNLLYFAFIETNK
jgi:hypothetical protein